MLFRIALCAVVCLAASLNGQVATGTIVGVVEDATGALIPNAQVTILHVATAESRQTRSNERGEFSVPYVHIGEYSVTAEAAIHGVRVFRDGRVDEREAGGLERAHQGCGEGAACRGGAGEPVAEAARSRGCAGGVHPRQCRDDPPAALIAAPRAGRRSPPPFPP